MILINLVLNNALFNLYEMFLPNIVTLLPSAAKEVFSVSCVSIFHVHTRKDLLVLIEL